MDLFDAAGSAPGDPASGRTPEPPPSAPLAVRMRPRTLDEVVGQQHLLGPGSPLRRLVERPDSTVGLASLVLWGPPGTGKTTVACLVAGASGRRFVELSAVSAGVKEVRAVVDSARRALLAGGGETVLFIDEVHRFSRTQQDVLLPAVENRWVTLVAATTENPSFSVVAPLLSRSLLLTLHPLDREDLDALVDRALAAPHGLGGAVTLDEDAREHLLRLAGSDARKALTVLEAAAGVALAAAEVADAAGPVVVPVEAVERAVDAAAVRYDRAGDQHYDVTSAFIKSMRGSDVDAALHYLARMLAAGEDPRFIARRIVVAASEDVGMADPSALTTAVAAAQAVALVGLPEARITLAQAVVHVATAPKSNAAYRAIDSALADVRAGRGGPVPAHLRDAHHPGAQRLGHGSGYRYAHDAAAGVVAQQYAPDDLVGVRYYDPTARGAERLVADRVQRIRDVLEHG